MGEHFSPRINRLPAGQSPSQDVPGALICDTTRTLFSHDAGCQTHSHPPPGFITNLYLSPGASAPRGVPFPPGLPCLPPSHQRLLSPVKTVQMARPRVRRGSQTLVYMVCGSLVFTPSSDMHIHTHDVCLSQRSAGAHARHTLGWWLGCKGEERSGGVKAERKERPI